MLDVCSPLSVQGDGNCMYRAASLALYSTEAQHHYLRVLASLELLEHRQWYEAGSPLTDLFQSPVLPSGYDKLVADATTEGVYAELVHIYVP